VHQARFEQAGLHRDVGLRLAHALVDGADAVADLQAQVPQQLHQFFQLGLVMASAGSASRIRRSTSE
jgi:hypothetical protein